MRLRPEHLDVDHAGDHLAGDDHIIERIALTGAAIRLTDCDEKHCPGLYAELSGSQLLQAVPERRLNLGEIPQPS